jgi:amino acid adenylation domain-containing protein
MNLPSDDSIGTSTPSTARQRLLALRRAQQQARRASEAQAILPRPHHGSVACSFSQEALWIVEQLVGSTGVYNSARAVRLDGALDEVALRQALQALLQRHEALRTGFQASDGVPMQVVQPAVATPLEVIDAAALGAPGSEAALQQRLLEEAQRAFDLSQPPLLRASLWRLGRHAGEHDNVLLLVVHHIVADGWSMQVIAGELGALYASFSGDLHASSLPMLPIQFADWAAWQRERMQGEGGAEALRYWRQRLAGLVPLEFPADHRRPTHPSHAGRTARFALDSALTSRLRALARAHDVTLFMLLLAAFKVLLMRYTRQDDVAVGTPVAGRDRPELEGLIGYFVNSVVLRTDLSGNPAFSELLARVRQTALDAYTHQELPFETLVAELSPQRDLGRNPLFEVSFALNNQPRAEFNLGDVPARALHLPVQRAKFDLSLTFVETDGALVGDLEYSTDLFEPETARRVSAHMHNLLESVAADADQRIGLLPLLGEAERRQMLVDWNRTEQTYPLHVNVQTMVEQQAARTPLATAVVFGDEQLSYAEFNARANRLAHHLRALGVRPEVPVGVCMERSVELAVALLAVLKAGGAFVPLDPELPAARLAQMLDDTATPVVLTQSALRNRLPQVVGAGAAPQRRLQCLDLPDAALERCDATNPNCLTGPDSLAYVIYTSGSTGQPKGVMSLHKGLTNHICWLVQTLGITPDDRVLQKTTISFDASVWEFFAPWQAGATLVLARPGEHRDPEALVRTLREQAITIVQLVPSMLRAVLDVPALAACTALRHMMSGGEALDVGLARVFQASLPGATLSNVYGPSEASDDATHLVVDTDEVGAANVPLGRPIANMQCHVLDAQMQPLPIGAPGELFIGGAGLARGYLGRPDLTAERFVAHPFTPGERLYRTGDLARYRADGLIEYLGRIDFQVKLRGHRIELGEIEAALQALPGVQSSVVVAREDSPGLKQLVAYVTGAPIIAAEIKHALGQRLPDYMVPAAVVRLQALPLLPNGKIDRKALPRPESAAAGPTSGAPRTPTEKKLHDIWSDVLGQPQIGVADNFFDLGGHSLLAMQVVSRLRAQLQVEIPLREMFNHPTLAALAVAVDQATQWRSATTDAAPLQIARRDRDGPLPVSYSQRRMWLVQALNPQTTAYNMTFALRLLGPLDGARLRQALACVVHRHEAFRTRFELIDGEPMQIVKAWHGLEFEHVDLRDLPPTHREPEARRLRDELAGRPFDLSVAGLYRLRLVQIDDHVHVLLWINHHAIGDHWSDGILLRETGLAYNALQQGREPELTPLQFDFADFAAWQRNAAQSAALEPQLAYWKARLRGIVPLDVPQDMAWHGPPSGRGGSVTVSLPASTAEALKRFSNAQAVTPFMTLLSCFKLLLRHWTGQTDIAVGSPVAGRQRLESEHLVGTLVNTLVLRTELAGAPTFAALLSRVKETALDALAHQDVPFERLVEELRFDRTSARMPMVQVMFNVTNAPFDVDALAGLTVEPFQFDSIASQFDLGLTVSDAFGELHLGYSTDVFTRATAERMLAGFVALLDQVIADPSRELHRYTSIGAVELRSLQAWNRTDAPFDREVNLPRFLAARMAAHAERVALRSGAHRLSYVVLDRRATQLARALRRRGIGRGMLVGLCVSRAVGMVVAQLGILKAGAAYVPLDPAYPAERLAYMAEDAQLALLVSETEFVPLLDWPRERTLLLDADASLVHAESEAALAPEPALDAQPQDPAYVIYTSGSTGRPKGVRVPHGAVVNFLLSMAREPGLDAGDVLVAVTTLSFDIAVLELLLPLCVGAQVVLASREQVLDGRALRALLESSAASVMQATPSSWRMLIESGWQGSPGFKALIGGEALAPDLAQQLLARCGSLWNLYGPTETTVWSSCWKVVAPEQGIRIGRPIANTQVHVLDEHGQRCPIGVAGEIFIGGAGVTLGYHDRPELTAQRFVRDPFSDAPQARMYRTGDRGRWTHDGQLEHLGRLDDQVKVRGHRIELGEIESVLAEHAQVARAVVIVREDRPGDARLVAYVVARQGASAPDATGLREHLRSRLPSYMLPQHFIALAELPLLPNGKIDRKALPAPAQVTDEHSAASNELPQTTAEQLVAQIWQELLGVDRIGREDNFFDLGGHSLLAMQVINALQQRAGIHLPLRRLVFESLGQIAATPVADKAPAGHVPAIPSSLGRMLRSVRELIGG